MATQTDTCPKVHALVEALITRYQLAPDGADFRVYLRQSPWEDFLLSRREQNWLIEIGYVVHGMADGVVCLVAGSRGDFPETWHPVGLHQFIAQQCSVHGRGLLSTKATREIRDYAEQAAAVWRGRLLGADDVTVAPLPCPRATAVQETDTGVRVVVLPPSY
jgi:hypothetical protein